jgi:hypothetical protein
MPQGLFSNSQMDMRFTANVARISEDLKLIRTEQQKQTKIMVHNARRLNVCGQPDCPVCGQTTDQER